MTANVMIRYDFACSSAASMFECQCVYGTRRNGNGARVRCGSCGGVMWRGHVAGEIASRVRHVLQGRGAEGWGGVMSGGCAVLHVRGR